MKDPATPSTGVSRSALGLDTSIKRPSGNKSGSKLPRNGSGWETPPLGRTSSSGSLSSGRPVVGRKRAVALGLFVAFLVVSSFLLVKDLKMFVSQEGTIEGSEEEGASGADTAKQRTSGGQPSTVDPAVERQGGTDAETDSPFKDIVPNSANGELATDTKFVANEEDRSSKLETDGDVDSDMKLSRKMKKGKSKKKSRRSRKGRGKRKQKRQADRGQQREREREREPQRQRQPERVQMLPPAPPAPVNPFDPVLPPVHHCSNWSTPPTPWHPKRSGYRPCPVCYVPVKEAMAARPRRNRESSQPILKDLTFVTGEDPPEKDKKPRFAGHQTWEERAESFNVTRNMHVHCGFVFGDDPGSGTGFDSSAEDRAYMHNCKDVVVASAIFGAYDLVQQPSDISPEAKRDVCFVMFVDEATHESFLQDGTLADAEAKHVGLWRLVVVKNLPYGDPRRTGKIPKLLSHRLFPNGQFSIWVDAKLELKVDPYRLLERFLWRGNFTWAISKHYARFDIFEEAERNKAAGKYNNASIDEQVETYKREGMTPYSEAKLPIISDVPEGCVIIREHTPITNLLACIWFNEVDRFTSRDQLSFGFSRDKIRAAVPGWNLNMFLDCERRNFVVQVYHKDVLHQKFGNVTKAIPTERV